MANLGIIIDADPLEPPYNEDVISLANRLLRELNITTRMEKIEHINATLFVILYENLFSERLPGLIRQPYSREDEIHNCQTVIDVVSTEIVHDSLSHIRGVDIVAGNITAISNLLDIFTYLLEYVVNKIECDVPTDNEDVTDKDSDLDYVHAEEKFETNDSSKNRNKQKSDYVSSLNTNENKSTVISHEDLYKITKNNITHKYEAPPSPISHNQSESLLGQKTVDSTDLDDGEEKIYQPTSTDLRSPPRIAYTERAVEEDVLKDYHSRESGKINPANFPATHTSNDFTASLPIPKHSEKSEKPKPFRATLGSIGYRSTDQQEKPSTEKTQEPTVVKAPTSPYNDLRELVEKTTAMTRVALRESPIRRRAETDVPITDIQEQPRPIISSDGARRAKELNARSMRASETRDKCQPTVKINKKVAFVSSDRIKDAERSDEDHCIRYTSNKQNDDSEGPSRFSSFGRPFTDVEDHTSRIKSSEGEKKGPSEGGPDSHDRKKTRDSTKALALHLARNRQPELGAAHMRLKTEDRAAKKKQDFIRRMYDDDLEKFTDDVNDLIDADNQASGEVESQMHKFYKNSAPMKMGIKKSKSTIGVVSCKKAKMKNVTTAKKKRPMSNHTVPCCSSPMMELKSDEDLFALLIEEFPHLHLSDHTWHELWRKGLNQIESLTRVYQDSKRKMSQAGTQMEDAAKRHNLLSEIMNKQLEHTQRLREVKERKTQQVQIRNRVHEKRMQSSRARRYYNEYQVRARGKQLKRRTKEEMVFRECFKDALTIQKERINDIRRYTSDQRKRQESRRQDEIDSVKNFYHDQFVMLGDKLEKEKKDNSVRNAAQQQMLDRMNRELRKKMEHEICLYQEQIFRDDDDVHFRKIDSEKLKHQLHKACYTSL